MSKSCKDEPDINKKVGYGGEKRLFIFNNLHRYFLYAAMIIILIKWWDVTHTLTFDDGYGFSIGTFVMGIEALCFKKLIRIFEVPKASVMTGSYWEMKS